MAGLCWSEPGAVSGNSPGSGDASNLSPIRQHESSQRLTQNALPALHGCQRKWEQQGFLKGPALLSHLYAQLQESGMSLPATLQLSCTLICTESDIKLCNSNSGPISWSLQSTQSRIEVQLNHACLCLCRSVKGSCNLLTRSSFHADDASTAAIVRFLFLAAWRPFMRHLSSWVYTTQKLNATFADV